jgi:hypothetical protein
LSCEERAEGSVFDLVGPNAPSQLNFSRGATLSTALAAGGGWALLQRTIRISEKLRADLGNGWHARRFLENVRMPSPPNIKRSPFDN